MAEERAYREALTSRIIPQMILSDASNPLTAPTPRKLEDPVLTARDRAIQRFTVSGNAIGKSSPFILLFYDDTLLMSGQ